MAESVSSVVKSLIDRTPYIRDMLIDNLLSISNYAEVIKPETENLCGKEVKQTAIIMAIRRYGEALRSQPVVEKERNVHFDIVLKTNIFDVNLSRRDEFLPQLSCLYEKISHDKTAFMNMTIGNHEMSISISDKYTDYLLDIIKDEEILHQTPDLVAISIVFTGDFFHEPGIVYEAVRRLAWARINVFEITSTNTELTFVVKNEDSNRAYEVLQSFLSNDY